MMDLPAVSGDSSGGSVACVEGVWTYRRLKSLYSDRVHVTICAIF